MGVISTRFLVFAMLVMGGVIISSNHCVSAQSCESDARGLVTECSQYVMRDAPQEVPSPECCNVIKKANMPCVCKYVTPAIELLIDMEKVVYVAETCGIPLPHGMKCGSITIPGA